MNPAGNEVGKHSGESELSQQYEPNRWYPPTTIALFGSSWSECGYCLGQRADLVDRPSTESSQSYTILVSNASLNPAWYEELIHQGWRRSGPAIYKPCNWSSCCPLLALRLPVADFSPSKSQRKLLRKAKNLVNKQQQLQIREQSLQSAASTSKVKSASQPLILQSKTTEAVARPNQRKQKQHLSSSHSSRTTSSSSSQSGNPAIHHNLDVLAKEQKLIHKSDVLKLLETWTGELLISSLSHPLFRLPTIAYKLRKPQQLPKQQQPSSHQKRKQNESSTSYIKPATSTPARIYSWTAVSTICAALAGLSRGSIDKAQLLRDLVGKLQLKLSANRNLEATSLITKVEAHEASGHIIVFLEVDKNDYDELIANESSSFGEQHDSRSHRNIHMHPTKLVSQQLDVQQQQSPSSLPTNRDILLEWWDREYPNDRLRDRSITMETINAFESCLDPAVHQLYARYQHVIHNDPDPFQDDVNAFLESDDEFRSSNGQQGDPWSVFSHRYPDGIPQDAVYGNHGAVPRNQQQQETSWIKQLKQMLESEYSHLSPQRRLRLSHFVARFCEYYVVSQFCTTRQQMSVTKSNSNRNNKNASNIPYGTYHQLYRINGRLIAVGVLDFLPKGLSSVYLFYNPSFAHNVLPLGKYCAIKEIEYCRDVFRRPYYYMGYYLHSNSKMQYKTDYAPSQLLCPKHYVWVPAEEAIPRLLARSPQHYCASLLQEGNDNSYFRDDHDETNNITSTTNPNRVDVAPNLRDVVENMHLQLNGTHLQVSDLTSEGQMYLKPHLLPFCEQAGRKASLECIVNLG